MIDLAFSAFPKMARLTRECVITEKIDGTNAQVNIVEVRKEWVFENSHPEHVAHKVGEGDTNFIMFAGSRTRYVQPGKQDNAGWAGWVQANAEELFKLGPGRHFGEWWGSKIQRGYDRTYKTFSLFNTGRWIDWQSTEVVEEGDKREMAPRCCSVVPVLYRGLFNERTVDNMMLKLRHGGSIAAPGYSQPEGIVIYHTAAGTMFKKLLENDDIPKSKVA